MSNIISKVSCIYVYVNINHDLGPQRLTLRALDEEVPVSIPGKINLGNKHFLSHIRRYDSHSTGNTLAQDKVIYVVIKHIMPYYSNY